MPDYGGVFIRSEHLEIQRLKDKADSRDTSRAWALGVLFFSLFYWLSGRV